MDAHAKFGRNARFHLVLSEGVIAKDVALHEVVDIEVRARVDCEIHRIEVEHDIFLCVRIQESECAAKRVHLRCCRSGILGRNELYQSRAVQACTQGAVTVDARDVVERCGVDLEQMCAVRTCRLVFDHKVEFYFLDGVHLVAVMNGEGTVEGLARHGHGLRELYRHASAHAVALSVFSLFHNVV